MKHPQSRAERRCVRKVKIKKRYSIAKEVFNMVDWSIIPPAYGTREYKQYIEWVEWENSTEDERKSQEVIEMLVHGYFWPPFIPKMIEGKYSKSGADCLCRRCRARKREEFLKRRGKKRSEKRARVDQ